ncbi:MAG: hypothetical protein KDI60_20135, partial [Xanthomonadales bacterium]|nr:hypothetical protein [Xanthomonadales bacterium]
MNCSPSRPFCFSFASFASGFWHQQRRQGDYAAGRRALAVWARFSSMRTRGPGGRADPAFYEGF